MTQTYTPLQPNQAPAYGTSGQAVADLQHNYNVQNQGQAGWTPLAEDGQYGPLTQAGVNWKPNNIVVTGGNASSQFNTNSNTLDTMLGSLNQLYGAKGKTPTLENTSDVYTQMLDRMSATSDLATKALIGTIQAQRSQQTNQINAQYDNYKRGLQMIGIQSNSAQSTPDLLLGHVQQAENEHQAKIQALDVEINKALIDAQTAKDNKDLSVLKEKMDYVKQLKQEQQDYLKNIASQMSAGSSIAESIIAGDYDMFQSLSSSEQSAYIKTLASSFGIPEQLIQGALQSEKERRADRVSKGSKTTKLTEAEKEVQYYSLADQAILDPDNLDDKGYLTAEAFKNLLSAGQTRGVTRTNIINRYKFNLYLDKFKYAKNYGLTSDEYKNLTENK